jgi:hypothetical protein
VQVNNCYNPLVGKVTGNLASVITPQPVTGCVGAADFYPLLDQWMAEEGLRNDIVRDSATGRVLTSKFTIMHTASRGDDKYSSNVIESVREVEKAINNQLFEAENTASGLDYNAFIYGGEHDAGKVDPAVGERLLLPACRCLHMCE